MVYVTFSLLFLVPYLLPQFLPTKKLFIIYLIICFFITALFAYDIYSVAAEKRWDSPGGIFGLIIVYLLGLGAALGILVRIAGFIFSHWQVRKAYYWALLLLAPFLLAGIIYGPDKWKNREPSTKCSYELAHIQMGETNFKIPTFSIFTVGLGDGNEPIKKMKKLHFSFNSGLREFCSISNNGNDPVTATSIHANFSSLEREKHHNERFKTLCQKENFFFCDEKKHFGQVPYMEDLDIYHEGHYNANRMLGGAGETLIKELDIKPKSEKHSYLTINDVNGKPLPFRCRDSNERLFCQSNTEISLNVRLVVGYVVSKENTKKDIQTLYRQTLSFLDEIKF